MKKSNLIVALSAGLLSLTSVGMAHADYASGTAHSCQPVYGVFANKLDRTSSGLSNNYDGTDIWVSCPVELGQSASSTFPMASGIVLRFNDSSYTGAIECKISKTNYNASSTSTSISKFGCETGGGCTSKYTCNSSNGTCTDTVSQYGGSNFLYWSTSELGFSSFSITDSMKILCSIPKAFTGGGASTPVVSSILSYYAM
jgi:hypothetical protein